MSAISKILTVNVESRRPLTSLRDFLMAIIVSYKQTRLRLFHAAPKSSATLEEHDLSGLCLLKLSD